LRRPVDVVAEATDMVVFETVPEAPRDGLDPKGYVNIAWGHITLDVRDGGG
jgi:hypothetical protein